MNREEAEVEVWNLPEDVGCLAGAQSIFNVVGRVTAVDELQRLTYSLNGGAEMPVAVRRGSGGGKRLARAGDFNIDTIRLEDLRQSNDLRVQAQLRSRMVTVESSFRIRNIELDEPRWEIDLRAARAVSQVAEVVDGRWRLGEDVGGRRYLGIAPEDTGYDRVLLIGHRDWSSGYEVRSRFRVDRWGPSITQGVGCAFKWNAHAPGDGSELPEEWTSGVAWSFSDSLGLTVRYGAEARKDEHGRWTGESVLGEGALSRIRAVASRWARRFAPTRYSFPQIVPGVEYGYRLAVDRRRLALTMWDVRRDEPPPQVSIIDPPEILPRGCVGFIAHHCAVRVYELSVSPLA